MVKFFENLKFSINIKLLIENVIVLFAIFPWVSFGLNQMDSQPWILFSLVIYYLYTKKIENYYFLYFWMILILILIVTNISYLYSEQIGSITQLTNFSYLLRGIASYSIIFLVWMFSIKIHKERNLINFYIIGSLIYVFYGYLQTKGYNFLDWMAYNRSSDERGVTSFAPEPTHLGIILYFLSWAIINLINKNMSKFERFFAYGTVFINIFGICFLAISAMSMLYIIITLLFIFFSSLTNLRNLLLALGLLLVLALFYYINQEEFQRYRAVQMALTFYRIGIWDFLIQDWSVNLRLSAIILPILGLIENSGLPGGFTSYPEVASKINLGLNNYFHQLTSSAKILSYNGSIIYEFGLFSLFIFCFSFYVLRNVCFWGIREILLITLILFSAVPLGTGLVPLLFGTLIYKKFNNL